MFDPLANDIIRSLLLLLGAYCTRGIVPPVSNFKQSAPETNQSDKRNSAWFGVELNYSVKCSVSMVLRSELFMKSVLDIPNSIC
jgi:hypothetical protein